jgi:sialidase-1
MPLSKTSLFQARTGGYHTYRIPGVLATARGTVLAWCEARGGGGGDWDGNDLLLRRSADGGATWEAPRRLAGWEDYGPGPVSNGVMLEDRAGAVHLLYCHNYARVYAPRSTDDGATFSDPVEITAVLEGFRADYPWRVIALGPGHGLTLRRGRLVIPLWMSDGTGTEFGPGRLGHRPSAVATLVSDDDSATWQCGDLLCRHGDGAIVNPSETVLAELSDGRVLANIRSESAAHRRLTAVSPDGAGGWSAPAFQDDLLEPVCMASLLRAGWNPSRLLFANPDTLEQTYTTWACDRKRLTVKLSHDDGATWPVSRVLEEGPAGYSDLALLPDGVVLCLYECGSQVHMYDIDRLVLARFDVGWVEGGA